MTSFDKKRYGNAKFNLLSLPDHLTTGVKTSSGLVIYPSGVILHEEWLRNYPKLAVPHRPGSNYDLFLRWLNLYKDKQYSARLRCPSLHSALSAVLNEYAQRTGEQRVHGYKQNITYDDTNNVI